MREPCCWSSDGAARRTGEQEHATPRLQADIGDPKDVELLFSACDERLGAVALLTFIAYMIFVIIMPVPWLTQAGRFLKYSKSWAIVIPR